MDKVTMINDKIYRIEPDIAAGRAAAADELAAKFMKLGRDAVALSDEAFDLAGQIIMAARKEEDVQ